MSPYWITSDWRASKAMPAPAACRARCRPRWRRSRRRRGNGRPSWRPRRRPALSCPPTTVDGSRHSSERGVVAVEARSAPPASVGGRSRPATAVGRLLIVRGNSFPRFSARRRMPLQALALKKYRRGTPPVSRFRQRTHAVVAGERLGEAVHSDVLSVKDSPCRPYAVRPTIPIPELCPSPPGVKAPKSRPPSLDRTPGTFSQTTQRGRYRSSNCKIDEGEVATRVSQSASKSRDAETTGRGFLRREHRQLHRATPRTW